jgi:hypothetical protein
MGSSPAKLLSQNPSGARGSIRIPADYDEAARV